MDPNRFYSAGELRINSGKRIIHSTNSTACPFATSLNDKPGTPTRLSRSPGLIRPRQPAATPWATGTAASDVPVQQFTHSRKGSGSNEVKKPWAPSAAPYATEHKAGEIFAEPVVKTHLENIARKRHVPGHQDPYRPSTGGVPYGREDNFEEIKPHTPSRGPNPKRDPYKSEIAPWSNPNNLYELSRNGKRTAVEKFVDSRPQSAKERRQAYGQELLGQIRAKEQARAAEIVTQRMSERKSMSMKSVSGLTRGIGERKPWI